MLTQLLFLSLPFLLLSCGCQCIFWTSIAARMQFRWSFHGLFKGNKDPVIIDCKITLYRWLVMLLYNHNTMLNLRLCLISIALQHPANTPMLITVTNWFWEQNSSKDQYRAFIKMPWFWFFLKITFIICFVSCSNFCL